MDVLPIFTRPVTFANRQNVGDTLGFTPAAQVVSKAIPSTADSSNTAVAKETPSSSQIAQAVKQVNDAFTYKGINLYASFEKDKISGVNIVKILEKNSNEVIRQLPAKEMVAFAQSLELPAGWRGQWILNMT